MYHKGSDLSSPVIWYTLPKPCDFPFYALLSVLLALKIVDVGLLGECFSLCATSAKLKYFAIRPESIFSLVNGEKIFLRKTVATVLACEIFFRVVLFSCRATHQQIFKLSGSAFDIIPRDRFCGFEIIFRFSFCLTIYQQIGGGDKPTLQLYFFGGAGSESTERQERRQGERRGRDQREGNEGERGERRRERAEYESEGELPRESGERGNMGTGRGGDGESGESEQKKISLVLNCRAP